MHYIWKEWKETVRGKGLWLSLAVMIAVSAGILFNSSSLSFDQGFYVLLINLFETLMYLIPILCLFIGAFSVYQEKEQKTLVMLLTKTDTFPVFLLKKSLALQAVFLVPLAVWFIIYLVLLKFNFLINFTGYAIFLLSIFTIAIVFMQLGVFVGSISRNRMQIIGFAIFIWFYFFFLHDFLLLAYLPKVTYENVKLFSLAYFLSPLQSVRIFLETAMNVTSYSHMSRLLQSFMWAKPVYFYLGSTVFWIAASFIGAAVFHKKEGIE
ncbi:ABC transporter permease [Bacillus sp. FJAT-27445]|uniref:ABC transporter permease n=1 Tax=Bacillus sp. FJAT-27445 TaxID=1679166 RepID=UPI0007438F6B|nr:ABC transporter permease subunit [Bacillus sp. FJAT-27445]